MMPVFWCLGDDRYYLECQRHQSDVFHLPSALAERVRVVVEREDVPLEFDEHSRESFNRLLARTIEDILKSQPSLRPPFEPLKLRFLAHI